MFDKKFFNTPLGVKHILAYELYVTHGLYQKDIAKFLGCSNNTVANYVKKLNKYKHLKDFSVVVESKENEIRKALDCIKIQSK
ncbi:helix-turn-helix domain-containing protein [Acinetobacter sp. YH16051]|uniref:helix-turn-helix domain-containing protein n=1 Tax=Acinetobacter sp. YH16051 TaxID=2601190 RepID=UPI0015D2E716|nr:helix-turn-helix domain-containing protein [Acinetobacter sp. YH16051]